MASDIDPRSGMRLPLPNREGLDEAGQKAYDRGMTPGATIAGLQGPAGIQLYSPKTAAQSSALNRYLRYEAGFTGNVREVAILITAREMDSQFEWVAHEPEALKEGVPSADVILNILARQRDPGPPVTIMTPEALRLRNEPAADCARYDSLRRATG